MQAARGASLSPSGDSDAGPPSGSRPTPVDESARRRSRRTALLLFTSVALVLYVLDQVTKVWAVAALEDQPRRPLIGDLLQLDLVRNPGAAFSTGTSITEVFTAIAVVAVLVVLWLTRRLASALWALALGVLLAGVAGNLTDRLLRSPGPLRGHVVDFFVLPNWPVFNVADICINVAAGLILVQAFRGIRLDGTPAEPDARPDAGSDARPDAERDARPDRADDSA